MKAFISKLLIIPIIASFIMPFSVFASDYTSSSFISRDPVIETISGDSTSATFENITAEGQTVIGESSGATFTVQSGFLYFGTELLNQNTYRWYENLDAITPTVSLAAQNTPITLVAGGDVLRLRLALKAPSEPYAKNSTFKLQYAPQGASLTCEAVPSVSFADLGGPGSGTIWRGYNNASVADGATLPGNLLTTAGSTGSKQTYEEANSSAASPDYVYVGVNADAEWDWVLQNNGAAGSTDYCFRMVTGAGTALNTYTNVAKLTTAVTPSSGGVGSSSPSGTLISINSDASCAVSRSVTLNLVATDANEVIVSNVSDFSGSFWENFISPNDKAWTLSAGDGWKTVYVIYRSLGNNTSAVLSDTIFLDTINNCTVIPPIIPVEPPVTPPGTDVPPTTPPGGQPGGGGDAGVYVFELPNYQGRSEFFGVNDFDLRDNPIGNDTISSIKIVGNAKAVLYQHINYNGNSEIFAFDDPNLSDNSIGDNITSSIIVTTGLLGEATRPFVRLFEHINFGGVFEDFFIEDPDLRSNFIQNDRASSFKLFGGAIVRLYEHIYYRGISQLFTLLNSDLRQELIGNDRLSSLQVFAPGSLIKGSASTVYYFDADGLRHPFPNPMIYFTWYQDFSQIRQMTDQELSQIRIGANVTYRPGVRLLKPTTSSMVYAVDTEKRLRWIVNESVAESLYGPNWQLFIDDLPDAFFRDYTVGEPINTASDYTILQVTAASVRPY